MPTINKESVNAAVDAMITKFATSFDLTLEDAVNTILESTTVAQVLAKQTTSVGLVKHVKLDPVKARRLANVTAADRSIAQLSRADYAQKIVEALDQLSRCATFEDATEESAMVQWLRELPQKDKSDEVGLGYTETMMRTIFFRLQEKMQQLLGSVMPSHKDKYETLLAETRERVTQSVEKRLRTVDPGVVDREVTKMMNEFVARCSISANTEWVIALYYKNIPVSDCVEFLVAMFIYTVDLKWCDCTDKDDFQRNFKTRRLKPTVPQNTRVHGFNSAPWAVSNWSNRLKGTNTLLPHEQSLLERTLHMLKPFADMLDRALDCLPPVGMRAVFRGVSVRLSDQFKIDDEFIMEPHTSTSLEGEEALAFMDPKKPGTFFVFRLHSAGMIDFMSAYPHQTEALLARHSIFRVANKLSRTVLRMLGCRFDVITLAEGGSNATDDELIEFLKRSAKQTYFIYREYLNSMIPVHVSSVEMEGKDPVTSLLLEDLNKVVQRVSSGEPHHVLIAGDAGCGKTSATLSAYSHLVQQEGCYAVLIPLPSVKSFGKDTDVDNAVLDVLDISKQCYETLCSTHKVFVILDSLDEVGVVNQSVVEKGLLSRNPLLRKAASVIVSCRTELFETLDIENKESVIAGKDHQDTLPSVAVWHISALDESSAREMIKRRLMHDSSIDESRLLEHAGCAPKSLQQNPLYLQMILRIPIGSLQSGSSRIDVYRHFINSTVQELYSDSDKGGTSCSAMVGRLQCLALNEMLLKQQWQVTVGKAKNVLECSGEDLEHLPFRVDDPNDNQSQLGFLHRSQAEYLAAVELAKSPNTIKKSTEHIAATAKRGTLYFLLEMEVEATQEAAITELLIGCSEGATMIPKLEATLKHREAVHGSESVEVASTLMNLGIAYGRTGDSNKKVEVTERALELQEKHLGPDHIELAATLRSLGVAYSRKGDNEKKLALTERALRLQEKHFGPDHIELAATLRSLGVAYSRKGDNDKYLELTDRAFQLQEKHLGADHIELASTLLNLGKIYGVNGDIAKKIELTERALQLKVKHFGPDHVKLAKTMVSLGSAYAANGDSRKYLQFTEQALQLQQKQYANDRIELANTFTNLGLAHGVNGNKIKKIEFLERSLELQETHYGCEHPDVSQTLMVVAEAYGENDEMEKAVASV